MPESNGSYTYYPGCSAKGSASAYEESMLAVAEVLGMRFDEIDDWNCCGATEYFSINSLPAYSLVARNLALAEQMDSNQVVASCSACYLNLMKTDKNMGKYPELGDKVNQALAAGGLGYDPGSLKVRHLLDVLVNDVGTDAIAEKVAQPLSGLRVAPYYGCVIVRPGDGFDDPEYPMSLDYLLKALGAEVVDFPLKSHCCGGHMTQISEGTAFELIRRLLHNADEYQADMIVTLCPMCQFNLDVFQGQVNRSFGTDFDIPVLFFTQLMGLAFGLQPEALGIGSEMVSAKDALAKIGQEQEAPPKPKRRDKQALPMPGEM
jgi:heterodisulfide reductase subunit B